LDNSSDRIIEVALVRFDEKTFKVIEEFSTLVNPEIEIPDLITNITNIAQKDIKKMPKWDEIMDKVVDFI